MTLPAARDVSSSLWPSFIHLRWAVVALMAASLPASDRLLELPVRYTIAVPALVLLAATNVAFVAVKARAFGERTMATCAAIDMAAIAGVLAASGGAANPFSALLLVYVALAASMFGARITFLLAALAACTFGALFLVPSAPAQADPHAHHAHHAMQPSESFSSHLYGMWIAFALAAALVAAFVTQVRRALRSRDAELAELRRGAEDAAKFAAIGTLAAGTAHELGTPLATIQVLACELASDASASSALREQARSIAAQVERCRGVIARMRPGARGGGAAAGEIPLVPAVRTAIDAWLAAHPDARVELAAPASAAGVGLTEADVEAALHVLLDNALHATHSAGSEAPIEVRVGAIDGAAFLEVSDAGAGVPSELAQRMGEPFLSTKEPGVGMGLGLYLVRNLLAQVGGKLDVTRRDPAGTIVRLHFGPAAPESSSA